MLSLSCPAFDARDRSGEVWNWRITSCCRWETKLRRMVRGNIAVPVVEIVVGVVGWCKKPKDRNK